MAVGSASYVKRMASNEAHAHCLAREHGVLSESGLLVGRVEPFWVFEDVAGLIVTGLRHGGVSARMLD